MPTQTYKCKDHGEFDVNLKFSDGVPDEIPCEAVIDFDHYCDCGKPSSHVIKPIAAAIVEGGTGGGKDMHLKR